MESGKIVVVRVNNGHNPIPGCLQEKTHYLSICIPADKPNCNSYSYFNFRLCAEKKISDAAREDRLFWVIG